VLIRRPSEEVFAFVADLENWAQWQPDFRKSELDTRGSVEIGNAFRQGLDVHGQRIELLGEVIGYEKDEKLSLAYAWKVAAFVLGFVFVRLHEASKRLTLRGEGRTSGVFSLFETLVKREINPR
jgi:uncharacterized protein YndB with AHSA1/START domain